MDLRDLFAEENPFSPRYILALIVWLPNDSAFYASRMGGPQYVGWDPDRYALAAQVDALRAGNYIALMVNRDPKKGTKPKPPEPFPTPDADKKSNAPKPGSFRAIAASLMAAQRRKKELLNGR